MLRGRIGEGESRTPSALVACCVTNSEGRRSDSEEACVYMHHGFAGLLADAAGAEKSGGFQYFFIVRALGVGALGLSGVVFVLQSVSNRTSRAAGELRSAPSGPDDWHPREPQPWKRRKDNPRELSENSFAELCLCQRRARESARGSRLAAGRPYRSLLATVPLPGPLGVSAASP